MVEVDTREEAKKSIGKSGIDKDVMVLADIYGQFEFLLRDNEMKIKPTAETIASLAATVFIQRSKKENIEAMNEKRATEQVAKGAPATTTNGPSEIDCPGCGRAIKPTFSEKKGVWYYECKECNAWINKTKQGDYVLTAKRAKK